MVFRCFELLQSGTVTAANHTVLLLTPLIEHGLGDVSLPSWCFFSLCWVLRFPPIYTWSSDPTQML